MKFEQNFNKSWEVERMSSFKDYSTSNIRYLQKLQRNRIYKNVLVYNCTIFNNKYEHTRTWIKLPSMVVTIVRTNNRFT